MPKVTVIIPVYNVEQYIEKCVRSLFSQTLDDIEYIFVNDCTKDKSIDIIKNVLEEYPVRKEQVKIIETKKNSGQAEARKMGIKYATGDYIIHCDSDDWVEPDAYEILYDKAIKNNADIVCCNYNEIYPDKVIIFKFQHISDKSVIMSSLIKGKLPGSLLCRLVRKDIVHDKRIYNPVAPPSEDFVLMLQYVYYSSTFRYVETPLYNYLRRSTSITGDAHSADWKLNRSKQSDMNFRIAERFVEEQNLERKFRASLLYSKFSKKMQLLPIVRELKSERIWIERFPEINMRLFFSKEITFKDKFLSLLILLNLYILVLKISRCIKYKK